MNIFARWQIIIFHLTPHEVINSYFNPVSKMWNSGKTSDAGFGQNQSWLRQKETKNDERTFCIFWYYVRLCRNWSSWILSKLFTASGQPVSLPRSAGSKSQVILLSRSTVRDMTHRFYYPQNTKIYIFTFYAFDFLERNVHWNTLSHLNNNLIMIIIIYISIS